MELENDLSWISYCNELEKEIRDEETGFMVFGLLFIALIYVTYLNIKEVLEK